METNLSQGALPGDDVAISLEMLQYIDQVLKSGEVFKFVKILDMLQLFNQVKISVKRDSSLNLFKAYAIVDGQQFSSSGPNINTQKDHVARQIVQHFLFIQLTDKDEEVNSTYYQKLLSIANCVNLLPEISVPRSNSGTSSSDDGFCDQYINTGSDVLVRQKTSTQRKRFKKSASNFEQLLNVLEEMVRKQSDKIFGKMLSTLIGCAKFYVIKPSDNLFIVSVNVAGLKFTYMSEDEAIARENAAKQAVAYLLLKEVGKFAKDEPNIVQRIKILYLHLWKAAEAPETDQPIKMNKITDDNLSPLFDTFEMIQKKPIPDVATLFDLIKDGKLEDILKLFIEKPTVTLKCANKQFYYVDIECEKLNFNGRGVTIKEASYDGRLKAVSYFLLRSLDSSLVPPVETSTATYSKNKNIAIDKPIPVSLDQGKNIDHKPIPISMDKGKDIDDKPIPVSLDKGKDIDPLLNDETKAHNKLIGDIIGELVLSKYCSLNEDKNVTCNVLSGIVQVCDDDYKNGTVVSLSTGNKCIEGGSIGNRGDVIIDSHAEIMARRGLLLYFYSQLLLCQNPETKQNSIFSKINNDNFYTLKDGISFYLYVSSAPCGDSRLFAVETAEVVIDRHPNRSNRKQLRCKVQNGCGTIPVKNCHKRHLNYMALSGGLRLLTMSCSDKLLKRNIVGIQGGLLSNIMEPIYLKGIIIGKYFNFDHASRALYKRVDGYLNELQHPYRLNVPIVTGTTKQIKMSTKSKFCINWVISENDVEVINPQTGKTLEKKPSRLCRMNFFQLFMALENKTQPLEPSQYVQLKKRTLHYYSIKQNMYQAFINAGLGEWVVKSYMDSGAD